MHPFAKVYVAVGHRNLKLRWHRKRSRSNRFRSIKKAPSSQQRRARMFISSDELWTGKLGTIESLQMSRKTHDHDFLTQFTKSLRITADVLEYTHKTFRFLQSAPGWDPFHYCRLLALCFVKFAMNRDIQPWNAHCWQNSTLKTADNPLQKHAKDHWREDNDQKRPIQPVKPLS